MRTALSGNMAEEDFNVVIVNRRFVLFLFLKYRFSSGIVYKSTGLAPVSKKGEKNDTHP